LAFCSLIIYFILFILILGATKQELEANEVSLNLDEMNRQWREHLVVKKPTTTTTTTGDDEAKEQGTSSSTNAAAAVAAESISFIECETNSEHSLLGAGAPDQTIGNFYNTYV
jgi:hypothetical protein